MIGSSLGSAIFAYTRIDNSTLYNPSLVNADLSKGYFHNTNMSKVNLDDADMVDTDFDNVDLSYSNFNFTNLSKAYIDNSNLSNINLYGSTLNKANFIRSDLNNVSMDTDSLSSAIFFNNTNINKVDKLNSTMYAFDNDYSYLVYIHTNPNKVMTMCMFLSFLF